MKKRNKTYVFFRRNGKLTETDKMLIPILKARGIKVVINDFTDKRKRNNDKFRIEWFEQAEKLTGGEK